MVRGLYFNAHLATNGPGVEPSPGCLAGSRFLPDRIPLET